MNTPITRPPKPKQTNRKHNPGNLSQMNPILWTRYTPPSLQIFLEIPFLKHRCSDRSNTNPHTNPQKTQAGIYGFEPMALLPKYNHKRNIKQKGEAVKISIIERAELHNCFGAEKDEWSFEGFLIEIVGSLF
jgi:hypothetical protein